MAPSKKGKGKGAVQVNVEAEAVSAKVALQNPALDAANNINGVEELQRLRTRLQSVVQDVRTVAQSLDEPHSLIAGVRDQLQSATTHAHAQHARLNASHDVALLGTDGSFVTGARHAMADAACDAAEDGTWVAAPRSSAATGTDTAFGDDAYASTHDTGVGPDGDAAAAVGATPRVGAGALDKQGSVKARVAAEAKLSVLVKELSSKNAALEAKDRERTDMAARLSGVLQKLQVIQSSQQASLAEAGRSTGPSLDFSMRLPSEVAHRLTRVDGGSHAPSTLSEVLEQDEVVPTIACVALLLRDPTTRAERRAVAQAAAAAKAAECAAAKVAAKDAALVAKARSVQVDDSEVRRFLRKVAQSPSEEDDDSFQSRASRQCKATWCKIIRPPPPEVVYY
eukprot:XP_001700038.1 predicted protein [Chlamydomonas reinhardtii]